MTHGWWTCAHQRVGIGPVFSAWWAGEQVHPAQRHLNQSNCDNQPADDGARTIIWVTTLWLDVVDQAASGDGKVEATCGTHQGTTLGASPPVTTHTRTLAYITTFVQHLMGVHKLMCVSNRLSMSGDGGSRHLKSE